METYKKIIRVANIVISKTKSMLSRLFMSFKRAYYFLRSKYRTNRRIVQKAARVLAVALLLLTITSIYNYVTRPNYYVSSAAQKLVGSPDKELAKSQLTYSKKTKSYVLSASFNGKKPTQTQYEVSVKGGNGVYGFNAPVNLSKKNAMTFYDNVHNISFSLTPTFRTVAGKYSAGQIVYPMSHGAQDVYSIKSNGLKEDIILNKPAGDSASYSYKLNLPSTLQARIMPSGAIGIYSANPVLFGNINYSDNTGRADIAKAQKNAKKDNLEFILMAPTVATSGGNNNATAKFKLNGNTLSINATGLAKLNYPISIDPSVVVTSATPFGVGNNEYNATTSGSTISTTSITGGITGSWTSTQALPTAMMGVATTVYDGYVYSVGGCAVANCTTGSNVVKYDTVSGALGGSWSSGTNLPATLSFTQAVAYNGYLYVLGGYNGSAAVNTVYSAPICSSLNSSYINGVLTAAAGCSNTGAPNGTIGTWITTNPTLSASVFDFAAVVNNGYLYAIGGATAATAASNTLTIYEAKINANGSTSTWASSGQTVSYATTGVRGLSAQVYNGFLYLMGGTGGAAGSTIYNNVSYATINGSALGSFTGSPITLISNLDNFASAVYSGYLYIWGGSSASNTTTPFSTATTSSSTYYAQINANGSIGNWQATTSITQSKFNNSGFAYNGYIYDIGGYDNTAAQCSGSGNYCSLTYYSQISAAGGLAGTIQTSANSFSLNQAGATTTMFMPGVTVYNGYIYVVGGCESGVSTTKPCQSSVYISGAVYYAAICTGYNTTSVFTTNCSTASTPGSLTNFKDTGGTLVSAEYGAAVTVAQGWLFAVGGCDGPGPGFSCGNTTNANQYDKIDSVTGALVYATFYDYIGPQNQFGGGLVYYNGNLIQFGGCNGGNNVAGYFCGKSGSTNVNTAVYVAPIPANLDSTAFPSGTWVQSQISLPSSSGMFGGGYTTNNGQLYVTLGCPGSGTIMNAGGTGGGACGTTTTGWTSPSSGQDWDYVWSESMQSIIGNLVGGATCTVNCNFVKQTSALLGPLFGTSMFADNGYLYVVGGCASINNLTTDFECGTWSSNIYRAPIGTSTPSGNSASVIGSFTAITNASVGFTQEWGAGVMVNNGELIAVGGCTGGTGKLWCATTGTTTQYQSINLGGTGFTLGTSWSTAATLNSARAYESAVQYGGYLFVVGGQETGGATTQCTGSGTFYCNDIEVYDIRNGGTPSLVHSYTFTTGRAAPAVTAYNGFFYIIGGYNGTAGGLDDVQIASIGSGGSLGSFTTQTMVANNYYVFTFFSGFNAQPPSSLWVQVNNTGSYSLSTPFAWVAGTYTQGQVVSNGGTIYVESSASTSATPPGSGWTVVNNSGGSNSIGSPGIWSGSPTTYNSGDVIKQEPPTFANNTATNPTSTFWFPSVINNAAPSSYSGSTPYLTAYKGYMNIFITNQQSNGVGYFTFTINPTNGQLGGNAGTYAVASAALGYNAFYSPASYTTYNGYIYALSANGNIQYAQLNSSGAGYGTIYNSSYLDSQPNVNWTASYKIFGASLVAYDGYLYVVGGGSSYSNASGSGNNCESLTTATVDCNYVWAAPISAGGGVGNFQIVGNTNNPDSSVRAVINSGTMYYVGDDSTTADANTVLYKTLSVVPHTAQYSYMSNNYMDLAPGDVYLTGSRQGGGSGYLGMGANSVTGDATLGYSFASSNAACTGTIFNTQTYAAYPSTSYSMINSSLPTSMAQDGCAVNSQKAQFGLFNINLDDSYTFTFPDDTSADGSHTTINAIGIYSHALPVNRMRTGQLLINGVKSSLDAPQ